MISMALFHNHSVLEFSEASVQQKHHFLVKWLIWEQEEYILRLCWLSLQLYTIFKLTANMGYWVVIAHITGVKPLQKINYILLRNECNRDAVLLLLSTLMLSYS